MECLEKFGKESPDEFIKTNYVVISETVLWGISGAVYGRVLRDIYDGPIRKNSGGFSEGIHERFSNRILGRVSVEIYRLTEKKTMKISPEC